VITQPGPNRYVVLIVYVVLVIAAVLVLGSRLVPSGEASGQTSDHSRGADAEAR